MAVSLNPNDAVSAGLADDFDGEITEVRFVPWDYNGARSEDRLAARVTIQPDEESGYDEFQQFYSAGELTFFAPSPDGDEPVDLASEDPEEREGPFIAQVGGRPNLSRSCNWVQFMQALFEAGLSMDMADGDASSLEGLRAHFNRIPQKKRGGMQNTDAEGRVLEILVVTEILEEPNTKSKSRGATKGNSKAASNGSSDLDERLVEVIVEALAEEESLSKAQLPQFAIKAFDGKDKAAAVKRVTDPKFLGSVDAWTFDADEGTLSL